MVNFIKSLSCAFLLLISLFWGERVNSAGLYETNYQTIKIGDYELWGCFDVPCNIDPNQINIFGYSAKSVSSVGFYYIGRNGEKTFDILESNNDLSRSPYKKTERISHVYFTPNDFIYLFHTYPFKNQGCAEDDNIYLKMIDLKGNRLKFQIILPKCLRGSK